MPFSIPGVENLSNTAKYVIAFAIIFTLLGLFALILRRLTGGRMSLSSDRGRARQPRLGIVDVYDLDRQRQLILLRRDNVEHLLLVGGPNDVVVETNIVRVPGARLPPAATETDRDAAVDRTVEIALTRPVIDPLNGRAGDRLQEAVVGAHLGAADLAPAASEQAGGREPVLKPTAVGPGGPAARPRPTPTAPPPPEPRSGARPNGSGQSSVPDMTRQLEAAIRRPTPPEPPRQAPVEPPRQTPPEPPRQAPVEPPRAATEPGRSPAPALVPPPPPVRAKSPEPAPKASTPLPQRPVAQLPAPRPVASVPAPPARPASPTPPAGAAAAGSSPAAGKPSDGKPDPFSIEDIEAEFARLLGRPVDGNKG